jgi:Skp family chaperone for outer membrane proteins
VKRIAVYLLTVAALAYVGYATTGLKAQTPGAGAAAPATTAAPSNRGTTAVFNVARVMKEFEQWQYFAAVMSNERITKSGELQRIRNQMVSIQEKIQKEPTATNRAGLEKELLALTRQFEDMERTIRKDIDDSSAKHLQQLFTNINTVVRSVADVNGFQLVLAYPDALTEEEMKSPIYYDLKLRPPAAMPFYVSPSVDITKVVVLTLNQHFKAPGPIPAMVQPAGATVPVTGAPMK